MFHFDASQCCILSPLREIIGLQSFVSVYGAVVPSRILISRRDEAHIWSIWQVHLVGHHKWSWVKLNDRGEWPTHNLKSDYIGIYNICGQRIQNSFGGHFNPELKLVYQLALRLDRSAAICQHTRRRQICGIRAKVGDIAVVLRWHICKI